MIFDIKKVKISTTVPKEDAEKVRDAMCEAGAGIVGNYSYCTTSLNSIGTFVPNVNSNPYIGEAGKLESVEETQIETVCLVEKVKTVISKLRLAHPYEEPVINIIPLLDEESFILKGEAEW